VLVPKKGKVGGGAAASDALVVPFPALEPSGIINEEGIYKIRHLVLPFSAFFFALLKHYQS